jgi:hypothetical protein
MAMTNNTSRHDYIKEIKVKYGKARLTKDKKLKTVLLNEAVEFTNMNRKYLIRLLTERKRKYPDPFTGRTTNKRGRRSIYGNLNFIEALLVCWRATNQSCAENLQPYLPELVPRLEAFKELCVTDEVRLLLLSVSISTIARRLKAHRTKDRLPLGISTTKPGTTLKSQIVVRKGRWDDVEPGFTEVDTVAHCGDVNVGQYIHSYDFVDIATSWSEQCAAMGMGERATVIAFEDVRKRFPFPVLGIDSDNGSEFINGHLFRYCKTNEINFTRSRPYHKNDNAHAEQKNNSAIREMVGYARYDTDQQLAIMQQFYAGPLRLYLNFCQPTRKRKVKYIDTETGKVKKTYFEAMTPYQRVMTSTSVDDVIKHELQCEYNKLNPIKLLAEVKAILERLEKAYGKI